MRPAFGTVLRDYRSTNGLTQEQLADRAGLSVRAIRNLEIGRTERPRRQTVMLLSTALRLPDPDHATLLAAAGHPDDEPRPGRCELPPDVPELVGRDHTVAAVTRVLTTPGPRLALVSGGPGVGRTALAVHVGHRVRDRFPDGQVYADLDHPGGALPADAVLGRVLRSLSNTPDLPTGRDERAAVLRACLAARRVLVVLDNVANEAQVRPLLTTGASAVLVTSRRELVALPGAHPVRLGPLTAEAAARMLLRLIGHRAAAAPAAARTVVDACARLPLALQIAGTWLVTRPHRPITDLAAILAGGDLDRLAVADLSMRASIAAHAADLHPDERRLLHRLGAMPEHLDPADLCRHLAVSEPALRDGLDGLTQANLLTHAGTGYRMNPLVRRYARDTPGPQSPRTNGTCVKIK